ncbi:hypothetical protein, conserved [Trypanosoma brucei brucei TREU927]|uniref:Coenzyme Q-binding protein COQ10 START domain-containing protein n=1 Tax=Trypanosoma brucei brucei (strain 927/4 GUTat10.1) TaxID=185431 RepID=Q57UK3_TRYB2|nr:hypothetical protein, conserved [Trypanosoma brucei brucei TREU927]AAX70721.1 hypothetical protein, conserved [Trypanosoma brucei]AAZ13295.1 hypothetical protein, conserved [Trypanosoma brucei brucei TREU927]
MRFVSRRLSFLSPPIIPLPKPAPTADAKPFFAPSSNEKGSAAFASPSTKHQTYVKKNATSSSGAATLESATAKATRSAQATGEPCTKFNGSSTNGTRRSGDNCAAEKVHHLPRFLSPDNIIKRVATPALFAASIVADTLNAPAALSGGSSAVNEEGGLQKYVEHCMLGWSPSELYNVVADVSQYSVFLPWCLDSTVHQVGPLGTTETASETANGNANVSGNDNGNGVAPATLEMLATLTVGFSFFREKYTSRVLLDPHKRVEAMLTEDEHKKRPAALRNLKCVWEFHEVPDSPRKVEVRFLVSFAFKNPMYSKLIMSHVVSIMTTSFEKHCEVLYGPPSCVRVHLPHN